MAIVAVPDASFGALTKTPSHMNKTLNPSGCSSCHAGRGTAGTPLLRKKYEQVCFLCHGARDRRKADTDIESLFLKKSRHPFLETQSYHKFNETLPEDDPNRPRHVSCLDCHSTHVLTEDKPMRKARGYDPGTARRNQKGLPPLGMRLRESESDYQVCYLCHSDSANLPATARNVAADFDTSNASYHPVELAGKNASVPSLVRELSVTSVIYCTSCHGNNDARGAQGPHASDFSPILIDKYTTKDGAESARAYALCYMCHDRKNVLGDNSFKRHNMHVVSQRTSCYTCHASHGSQSTKNLISFNASVVTATTNSTSPTYVVGADGMPKCYLKCHDKDHNSSSIGGKQWPW